MKHYLIQDPLHDYAVELMKRIRDRFGYTPLVLFTEPKRRYYQEQRYPELAELAPHTRFDVSRARLPRLAAELRERYGDVAGLVPFSEKALDDAPRLLELFGIDWNSPATVSRFRDKHELKTHIAAKDPGLRINRHFLVRAPEDLDRELPERFILKPNAGFGSVGVGLFSRDTPREELRRFVSARSDAVFLLEEFVSGTLYTVDGWTDEAGRTQVAAVFSSGRQSVNGSPVVYDDGFLVHHDTDLFRRLAAYAGAVLSGGGLRRSPFHMEIMVDERGPCLIEVGARLIGNQHVYTVQLPHGGKFDYFSIAAHGYVSKEPFGDPGLDWARYDSLQAMKLYPVSEKAGLILRVDGVEAVERMPEFVRWVQKPEAGQMLEKTTSLMNIPYGVILASTGTLDELKAAAAAVRRTLVLVTDASLPVRLLARLRRELGRAPVVLGWQLRRGLLSLREALGA